jgi:hypothetical protein
MHLLLLVMVALEVVEVLVVVVLIIQEMEQLGKGLMAAHETCREIRIIIHLVVVVQER